MRRRSSIFSFKTLRGPRRLPSGWLWAVVLVVLAEVGARALVAQGVLRRRPALAESVVTMRAQIARQPYDLWLFGNSTLGAGVNSEILAADLGQSVLVVGHVGASARSLAVLADDYFARAEKVPQAAVLFVYKDDLNPHGSFAAGAQDYIRAATGRPGLGEWFALRGIRGDLESKLLRLDWKSLLPGQTAHAGGTSTPSTEGAGGVLQPVLPEADAVYDGQISRKDERRLAATLARFAVDRDAIQLFADTCRKHGVGSARVVMLPVTDVIIRYHDTHVPHLPFATIRAEVRDACTVAGVDFVDLAEPQSDYRYFGDAIHVNEAGRAWLTGQLSTRLRPATAAARPKQASDRR